MYISIFSGGISEDRTANWTSQIAHFSSRFEFRAADGTFTVHRNGIYLVCIHILLILSSCIGLMSCNGCRWIEQRIIYKMAAVASRSSTQPISAVTYRSGTVCATYARCPSILCCFNLSPELISPSVASFIQHMPSGTHCFGQYSKAPH